MSSTDDPSELTVARMAEAAGVSQAALYRHFSSVEALVVEVALGAHAAHVADLATELSTIAMPEERLRHRLDQTVAWGLQHPGLYRCLGSAFRSPDMVEPYRSARSLRDLGLGPFVDDISAVRTPVDPDSSPEVAELWAAVVWTHLHGYIASMLYLPERERRDEAAVREVFLDLQLAGLTSGLRRRHRTQTAPTSSILPDATARRRVDSRDRLIDAARELVTESQDLAALTVRRLADRVGISVGAVYGQFADRETILIEMAEGDRRRWLAAHQSSLIAERDPVERAVRRLEIDLGWAYRQPLQFQVLWLGARPAAAQRFVQGTSDATEGWRPYANDLGAALHGRRTSVDVQFLAMALWADLHGFLSMTIVTPDFPWPPSTQLRRTFVDFQYAAVATVISGM